MNNFSNIKSIFLIFCLLVLNVQTFAQDYQSILNDLDPEMRSMVERRIPSNPALKVDEENYNSITQNEYSNVVTQIKQLDAKTQKELYLDSLQEKRLELAIRLCKEDKNACYLVEQYQDYMETFEPQQITDLEIFGVDYFSGYPLSFDQLENTNVPNDYVLRKGDIFEIAGFGIETFQGEFSINNNGELVIEDYGSIFLDGLNLSEAKKKINAFFLDKYIGIDLSISLKKVNSIQIYALGVLRNPGTYNISALSKSINAIIASGGFDKNSSLRNIFLKRDGKTISSIDLYDFLIDAENYEDPYLINGDVIQVAPRLSTVTLFGEVNRPAIYEFAKDETIDDLIRFGLGFTEFANIENIVVERINKIGQKTVMNASNLNNFKLQNGDVVIVNRTQGETLNYFTLSGSIRNQGIYEYKDGMSLSSILNIENDLLEETYMGLILLKRYNSETKSYSFSSLSFQEDSFRSLKLQPKDHLFFLSKEDTKIINSDALHASLFNSDLVETPNCLSRIKLFSNADFIESAKSKFTLVGKEQFTKCSELLNEFPELTPILLNASIPVVGSIRNPGLYPISNELNGHTLFKIAGDNSSIRDEDLTFEVLSDGNVMDYSLNTLKDISNIGFLNVKANSKIQKEGFVTLIGEFDKPGVYPITPNTRLLDIYKRSGGLNSSAYPEGAILTRQSIMDKEKQALDRAKSEIADILASAVTSGIITESAENITSLTQLMNEVGRTSAVGRLVADLDPRVINKDLSKNLLLHPGDVLYMPKRLNTVTVVGSVLNPVTIPYDPKYSVSKYIEFAGGYKDYADPDKSYVLLPNGMSIHPKRSLLFFNSNNDIYPGSTIIVPRKARPLSGLSFAEAISPVLANLSITMASINSISSN